MRNKLASTSLKILPACVLLGKQCFFNKFLVCLHGEYNILVKLVETQIYKFHKFTWCFHKA